jgi:hypothetical protein
MTQEHKDKLQATRKPRNTTKGAKLKDLLKALNKGKILLGRTYEKTKDVLPSTENFQQEQMLGWIERCRRGVELEIEKEIYTK